MNLFLDSSVLLAACGSRRGASRELFNRRAANAWVLIATTYVIEEVELNLQRFPVTARADWPALKAQLDIRRDVLTLPQLVVFEVSKDRPILFSGLAYAQILLTLDTADFPEVLGKGFYGLEIMRPGEFLRRQRERGELK